MKTPREILFQRHRSAQQRLDEVRDRVLAEHFGKRSSASGRSIKAANDLGLGKPIDAVVEAIFHAARQGRNWFVIAWRHLIWPSRRAWAGLGALWLLVLVANLGMRASAPRLAAVRTERPAAVAQAFAEQRRVLSELLPGAKLPRIQATPPTPGRRSERLLPFKVCGIGPRLQANACNLLPQFPG